MELARHTAASLRKGLLRMRLAALARLFPLIFRSGAGAPEVVRLGSAYGGWWVPDDRLGPGSVCYCAGVGEDATFDFALAELGCTVVSLDPTPLALAHMATTELPARLVFLPVGLAGRDGVRRFYAPRNPRHASFSIANLQRTGRYIEARVKTLATLMGENEHGTLDLLKLDIEGAEYEVLNSLLRDGIRPRVICVEFDQPTPVLRTWRAVRALARPGYAIAKVERFNLTFVAP